MRDADPSVSERSAYLACPREGLGRTGSKAESDGARWRVLSDPCPQAAFGWELGVIDISAGLCWTLLFLPTTIET
jgi:hypothetical protein